MLFQPSNVDRNLFTVAHRCTRLHTNCPQIRILDPQHTTSSPIKPKTPTGGGKKVGGIGLEPTTSSV